MKKLHIDPYEKTFRQSKKLIVAIVVIEQLVAMALLLGYWGKVGPWPSVAAIVVIGAVAGTAIFGQAWMERYTRVAFFAAQSGTVSSVVSSVSSVVETVTSKDSNKDPEAVVPIPPSGGI